MAARTEAPSLPSAADYAAAKDAMHSSYNGLEKIEYALRDVIGPWMDAGTFHVRPDFATIGELWSFVDAVEGEASSLETLAADLRQWLQQLESMRSEVA